LSCFCDLDEDTRVDLKETEELEDLAWFWREVVDTGYKTVSFSSDTRKKVTSPLDPYNKEHLWLGFNIEITSLTSGSLETDCLLFFRKVLLDIRIGALENDATFLDSLLLKNCELAYGSKIPTVEIKTSSRKI
jgi:hypothetical protein